jgi:hypothetical protein
MNKLTQLPAAHRLDGPGVVMNRKSLGKWISLCGLIGAAALLLNMASCAHSQELVGIQVQPSVETVGSTDIPVQEDANFQVQLRALGIYVHPPVTKDITNQVVWASNTPSMFTVNSTGLLNTTGDSCGGTLVSATVQTNSDGNGLSASGAVVTGYMTANVVCFSGSGTGTGPAVTVTFANSNPGIVASSPTGLSCASPNSCVDNFPVGTEMSLTATPTAPSTTATWGGTCPEPTTTAVCSFTVETNVTVTASFN